MSTRTIRAFSRAVIGFDAKRVAAHQLCVAVNMLLLAQHEECWPQHTKTDAAEKKFRDAVFDATGHRVGKRAGRFVPR